MTDAIATDNETLRAIREWRRILTDTDDDLSEAELDMHLALELATVLDANALVPLLRALIAYRLLYASAVMPAGFGGVSSEVDALPPEWRKLVENNDE